MLNFFKGSLRRVKEAYKRTTSFLGRGIRDLFSGKIDAETLEKLEELLFQADLGVTCATELTAEVATLLRKNPTATPDAILHLLKDKLIALLQAQHRELKCAPAGLPTVLLIVGVNGNGKTTSIAKLAHLFAASGEKVILGAADTFRAAAIDQLTTWSERIGCDIVAHNPGADPSAVVFDTITAALARKATKVLIDTAGRLHTKTDLMQELAKIRRVSSKLLPDSPHETLLVLDATTGQNAIDQARTFNEFTPLTGIILTKLDGTAKGGIVVAIEQGLRIPVKFVGLGESIGDLVPFDPEAFASSLFA